MTREHVEREIREAVALLGRRVRRLQLLTPPDLAKRNRSTWRVDADDGATLKARRLESPAAVREQIALREGLDAAFTRALAGHGHVLFEEWVEGRPLDADEAVARAGEAGALLGSVHGRALPEGPHEVATERWRAQAEHDLDVIHAAGALDAEETGILREELARHDPRHARSALIHRDYCAENTLVAPAGRLRVIDNEWFTIDAAGLDLGRTLHRWPLPDAAREAFLAAYADAAGAPPGPLDFWILFAVLWSARARLDQPAARLAVPVAAARHLAAAARART